MDTDISLVPTDELIAEVAKRYDACIFMGRKYTGEGKYNWTVKRRYFGDLFVCAGLSTNMTDIINQAIAAIEVPHDGNGT